MCPRCESCNAASGVVSVAFHIRRNDAAFDASALIIHSRYPAGIGACFTLDRPRYRTVLDGAIIPYCNTARDISVYNVYIQIQIPHLPTCTNRSKNRLSQARNGVSLAVKFTGERRDRIPACTRQVNILHQSAIFAAVLCPGKQAFGTGDFICTAIFRQGIAQVLIRHVDRTAFCARWQAECIIAVLAGGQRLDCAVYRDGHACDLISIL